MDLVVVPDGETPHRGVLFTGDQSYPCAIGKAGVTAAKREGDHMSPVGVYVLRRLHYRPDVFPTAPATGLPVKAIDPQDGWCDAADHPDYNRPVRPPFAMSHEKMWRDDGLYDLVVEIGYNDAPPVSGLGSAIFLHIARPDFAGTEGCVALAREDLLAVLAGLGPDSCIEIHGLPGQARQ
ncbi:L,D-transpeptidase family protein [Govanella unica]|uniref:L,D-transpeptidase family protein n=1 Tax=Govanella unica TaxID=2975056 RepID=A0A9X3TVF5_9PROT|nr:L,D-transpeptidase family protein [Govania unica]MDA5192443.1 L,D-transpeptidase family protein [Govania unica]